MAMTQAGLSAAIKTNLSARGWVHANSAELQQFCDDLAGAIVSYITGNAVVLPGTFTAGATPVTGAGIVT